MKRQGWAELDLKVTQMHHLLVLRNNIYLLKIIHILEIWYAT